MDNFFTLSKQTKIMIYGTGVGGVAINRSLSKQGYRVYCFIDKRAEELKCVDGIRVVDLHYFVNNAQPPNAVVIISLQNALIHDDVAKELQDIGFSNIIFFPKNLDRSYMRMMRIVWLKIQMYDYENLGNIPKYSQRGFDFLFESNTHIALFVPKSDLRMKTMDMMRDSISAELNEDLQLWEEYAGKEIQEITPYSQLFDYLEGKTCDRPDKYLRGKLKQRKKEAEDALLDDRQRMYEDYKNALKYDPDMFLMAPIKVECGGSHRLFIIDGMHRALFLVRSGYDCLPVLMSKSDYVEYSGRRIDESY